MAAGTAVVLPGSDLVRKKWVAKNLSEYAPESFFSALKSDTANNVIFTKVDLGKKDGETVVFDYKGARLSGKGFKGKEQIEGKGEKKKRFSDKVVLETNRLIVDNGSVIDAHSSAAIDETEHSDSVKRLSEVKVAHDDQGYFDAMQGILHGSTPTHVMRPNDKTSMANIVSTDILTWDGMTKFATNAMYGWGFNTGSTRASLMPIKLKGGEKMFLFLADPIQIEQLKADEDYQKFKADGDVRGENNALFGRAVGKIGGNFIVVEAPIFKGIPVGSSLYQNDVDVAGLKYFLGSASTEIDFTDLPGSGVIASRGVILGANAIQSAGGETPEYTYQEYDHRARSDSGLRVHNQIKKTKLVTESNSDYNVDKLNGVDFGIVVVESYAGTGGAGRFA